MSIHEEIKQDLTSVSLSVDTTTSLRDISLYKGREEDGVKNNFDFCVLQITLDNEEFTGTG